MEVILNETIDTLGEEGATVTVKSGYGRNYLLPQGKAVLATKIATAERDRNMVAIQNRLDNERGTAETIARKIAGTTLTIAMRSGEDERLYGSVTNADIAEKFAELGITVDKKRIVQGDPIKTLGITTASYKAGYQVVADFKLEITSINAPKKEVAPEAPESTPAPEETPKAETTE